MMNPNRRTVLGASAAIAGASLLGRSVRADPNGYPIGLQLYSVGDALLKDCEGTLRKIAEIGYREIESAGGGPSVKQIAEVGKSVGLRLRSAHISIPDCKAAQTASSNRRTTTDSNTSSAPRRGPRIHRGSNRSIRLTQCTRSLENSHRL